MGHMPAINQWHLHIRIIQAESNKGTFTKVGAERREGITRESTELLGWRDNGQSVMEPRKRGWGRGPPAGALNSGKKPAVNNPSGKKLWE